MRKRHLVVAIIAIIILGIIVHTKSIKIINDKGNISLNTEVTYDSILNTYNKEIIFIENNEKIIYTFKEIGIIPVISDKQVEKIENSFYINKDKLDISYDTTYLFNKLNELNIDRKQSNPAFIKKENNKYSIGDIIRGNYLNIDKIYEFIEENMGDNSIIMNLQDYYVSDIVLEEDKSLLKDKISLVNNFCIAYTNGFNLKINDIVDYTYTDGTDIYFDESLSNEFKEYIDRIIETELDDFDTVGNSINFTTSNEHDIVVEGGTWGNIFSSDLETEYILDKLLKNDFTPVLNRTPIYSQKMNEISGTYIEISKAEQHIWYYEDGELVMDSDIVTGNLRNHDTPSGIYFVSERISGKYLRGPGYVTWVNKWMRLTNSGIGLHDATWRSKFGGEIYTYDGSHGCINLPKKFAYDLFDRIKTKTCVVIY